MRIDFKKQKIRKSKFCKFCEDNSADYFETDEEYGVWIIPKKYGSFLCAIKLKKDGRIDLGMIRESCMNFENDCTDFRKEEQDWIVKIFALFKKYKP